MQPSPFNAACPRAIAKSPTGILGLDEVTHGGLPTGRPTLVCGDAGSGKTLLATSFLVNGEELANDVASLGFDLPALVAAGKLFVDYVHIERSEIEETGEYDLEGLFVRLDHAIRSIGAKRLVLDTIESLFSGLGNANILRAEVRRLFRWLKDKGLTAIITAERGENTLTRQGLEEYVSDAVILLDHRVTEQVSTRRLRVVKYRGSHHGTNEYPFLIDRNGLSVLPVTSLGLAHSASVERLPTGVRELDDMLGGKGYFRGSTVLVSGTAGTGKTSLAAHFAAAACRRGERVLYFLFEESPLQLLRNMRSIGIDLQPWTQEGLLQFQAERPAHAGLETHLASLYQQVRAFQPSVTIVDAITNLLSVGTRNDVRAMLMRVIDYLKVNEVTGLFTSLTPGRDESEDTEVGVSSLMDTWIAMTINEHDHQRHRMIRVLKSRGMRHSNRVHDFELTDHGLRIVDLSASAA
jgi:circadian clock protein KaiC